MLLESERQDLKLLFTCTLTVILTWVVVLGWSYEFSIMSRDGIALCLPLTLEFLRKHADWGRFVYTPLLLGGSSMTETLGTPPILTLLGKVGFSAVAVLNGLVFFIQIAYSFFGIRAAIAFPILWGSNSRSISSLSWMTRIGLIELLAFTPVLGWKLSYGHYTLVLGTFLFITLLSLILSSRSQQLTMVMAGLSVLTILHCFTSMGQQTLVYSLIFGAPFLLATLWPDAHENRKWMISAGWLLIPGVLSISALALALPQLVGIIHHSLGNDAQRTVSGDSPSLIYNYVTASARDWISSIPWSNGLISFERNIDLWHEINYPLGPSLLLLALIPWKKCRFLAVGLVLGFGVPILFSMNIQPFSTLLPTLIPLLKSFRVPHRAMLPFSLILPILAAAALFEVTSKSSTPQPKKKDATLGFRMTAVWIGAVLIALASPLIREVAAWSMVIAFLVFRYSRKGELFREATLIFGLGVLSVSAFGERVIDFKPIDQTLRQAPSIFNAVVQQEPSLANSLVRAKLNLDLKEFEPNSGLMLGISSIDGYWNYTRRFGHLLAALQRQPYRPDFNQFRLDINAPIFPSLMQLYNIGFVVDRKEGGVQVKRTGETLGSAWFSNSVALVDSWPSLAERILDSSDQLKSQMREQAWVVKDDPNVIGRGIEGIVPEACRASKVLEVDSKARYSPFIKVRVSTAGRCPLTLATNYVENLHAFSVLHGAKDKELPVFPVFGALTGILIPAGVEDVVIEDTVFLPFWGTASWYLGLCLMIGGVWLVYRKKQVLKV